MVEKERVSDFLASFNIEHNQARVQILGCSLFPTLQEAYAHVQQEKSQMIAMVYAPTQHQSTLATIPQRDEFSLVQAY